ncbi:MAG: indolepyruvate ferredoxin oxidoreductase, partial [Deltaproteobacteria bacterium]|nr:indolepyruvate ferredoxin oxidoreductase [Deltaproteobacteria bacterium]
MSLLSNAKKGENILLMGNDAIARGALEAGVSVVAGYPGTPSSEIVQQLSKEVEARNIYVEWSVNEKVAL